ncbi:hypothetical protein PWT90_05414 [Aphanocladium album]|nr:hypothetical protein PWT90_05414 [Aphanocladium album]
MEAQVSVKPPSRRRENTRVKTGCATCRARRIKCDENWPACLQCRKARRDCPGGGILARPHTVLMATAPSQRSTAGVVPTSLELAMTHYFHNRIQNSCWDEFNAELWQQAVPRTAHSAAAMWHATNLLAGSVWAHDRQANLPADAAETFYKESMRQHSLCVKHLLAIMRSPRILPREQTIVLLANVALSLSQREDSIAMFSQMLGKIHELIRYWKFWQHVDSDDAHAAQALCFWLKTEGLRRESLLLTPAKPAATWREAIVDLQERRLGSAVRAYIELQMIWISVQAVLDGIPFRSAEEKEDVTAAQTARSALGRSFAVWETRYDALLSSSSRRGSSGGISRIRLAALGARRILLGVMLSVDLTRFRDETCWDEFEPSFRRAFLLIESSLALQGQDKPPFTPLLMHSLNFIARVCRAPTLRQRVATLLHACLRDSLANLPTTVGHVDAPYALVSCIIGLEEAGWEECSQENPPRGCVRGEFVCSMHRVATVHEERPEGTFAVYIFRTVADVLNGRVGLRIRPKRPAASRFMRRAVVAGATLLFATVKCSTFGPVQILGFVLFCSFLHRVVIRPSRLGSLYGRKYAVLAPEEQRRMAMLHIGIVMKVPAFAFLAVPLLLILSSGKTWTDSVGPLALALADLGTLSGAAFSALGLFDLVYSENIRLIYPLLHHLGTLVWYLGFSAILLVLPSPTPPKLVQIVRIYELSLAWVLFSSIGSIISRVTYLLHHFSSRSTDGLRFVFLAGFIAYTTLMRLELGLVGSQINKGSSVLCPQLYYSCQMYFS